MEELIINEDIKIENIIYNIKGKQVMLDSDLAKIYKCKNGTKEINQAVKNNPNKFPERYSWVLTDNEFLELQSKNLTTNISKMSRTNPRVFTEYGVYMLSTILKTKVATEITLKIMDTFVAMRHYIGNNLLEQKYYNDMTIRHDSEIRLLFDSFDKLNKDKEINELYFDGKEYDAHSKILDIFNTAKSELIIIDRYTDKTILDIIKNLKCNVILITGSNTKLTNTDIDKYNKTYDNLRIIYNDSFHDRYFIIDKKNIYHSGNSINHIGYRKSSIDILGDTSIINTILGDINNIIKKI